MGFPNFFLVGAPKAATTSLYHAIGRHPNVYVSPIKEPGFFAPDVIAALPDLRQQIAADAPDLHAYLDGPTREPRAHGIVTEWSRYLQLFAHAGEAVAIGEGTTAYLGSPAAPSALAQRVPHARILLVLRDPADRLFAHYAAARASGATRQTFPAWVEAEQHLERSRSIPVGPIAAGRYATHLPRYRAHFPAERLHIMFFEDVQRDTARVLRGIFRFLGVDEPHAVPMGPRLNVTTVPRVGLPPAVRRTAGRVLRHVLHQRRVDQLRTWFRVPQRLRPTREDRVLALRLYEEDIAAVTTLTGRDLHAWTDLRPG